MQSPITSEVIDPKSLSPVAKQGLIDELYATHEQIFDGVSKAEFASYVVDSPAERTRIQIYRDRGRMVGYFAVHTFVQMIDGEQWVVVRAESGKLPAYRRGAKGTLMIAEVLRIFWRYPGARKAYLGCFVHPSAYVAMGHVAPALYPHWERPTPAPIKTAMHTLGEAFDLDTIDPALSGVRKVGWITRESEGDRRSWADRRCPMTEAYMRQNPGYREGHGLLTMIPLSLSVFVSGCLRYARRVINKQLRNLDAQLEIETQS